MRRFISMSSMIIDVYSHHFAVSGYNRYVKELLIQFSKETVGEMDLIPVGRGKYAKAYVRFFAASTKNRKEFRFHFNQFEEFQSFFKKNLGLNHTPEIREHSVSPGKGFIFQVNKRFETRDKQIPVIEYLASERKSKLVSIQTGQGKTFCSMSAVARMGKRVVLVIQSKYVDKWIGDVKDILMLKTGELLLVRGSKDLKRLIDLGLADELEAKVIIITDKTMYNYIKDYEKTSGESDEYGCKPYQFYETIGAGVRVIDEVHQGFHANFRQDLYANIPTTIDLSATVEPEEPFTRRMYLLKWPSAQRFQGVEYDKYIAVTALFYRLYSDDMVRYIRRGRNQYSHIEFEESVTKRKKVLKSYLALLETVIKVKYLKVREPGQKLLVFASTKAMCRVMASDIKKYAPHLKVGTYIGEDDYSKLISNDISVSTLQSSGAAVDIPGLRITVCTTAVGSKFASEQSLGRLRRMKDWPQITPEYYYFVCEDIGHHVEYHTKKIEYFADKVLSHKTSFLRGGI